jgi:hypothetical protein
MLHTTTRTALGRLLLIVLVAAAPVGAQSTPQPPPPDGQTASPAGPPAPDDRPSLKVGATLFLDYGFVQRPEGTDAAGHRIHPNAFNVQRAYINLTGQVHHLVAFRVTPDIRPETGSGSSLSGSYSYQLKYAFAQLNLADWLPRDSWVRLGIQQTPYVEYNEQVYRYRWQGSIFPDREGFLSSSDAGLSFRTVFPADRGDLHVGVYNGEGYRQLERNDRKALMIRGTWRPLAGTPVWKGVRLTGFYDADAYVQDGERRRGVVDVSFDNPRVHAGAILLRATDRVLPTARAVDARGYSLWVVPRTRAGLEGLLRYDRLEPDRAAASRKSRTIAGLAYWLPAQGAAAAVMLDLERVTYRAFTPARPEEQRIALRCLVSF